MIRKTLAVSNIHNYDIPVLQQELVGAGIPITAIHKGSGAIVFEFSESPTEGQITSLQTIVTNHTPDTFTWTGDNGESRSECVRCAEDVDRLTGRRIRGTIGGQDPVQEQLKQLRLALWSVIVQLHPSNYTQAERDTAAQIEIDLLAINTEVEAIRLEGKNYKTSKGWEHGI